MKIIILTKSEDNISSIEFDTFKEKYKLSLPISYKEFILTNNGGYPELSAFGNPYEDGFHISLIYCIDKNYVPLKNPKTIIMSSNEIIESHQKMEFNIPSFLYPFGCDDGGNNFCVSMQEQDLGVIYKFNMDDYSNTPSYVCDSFEEFINGLENLSNET